MNSQVYPPTMKLPYRAAVELHDKLRRVLAVPVPSDGYEIEVLYDANGFSGISINTVNIERNTPR